MKHFFRNAAMVLLLAVAATGCAGLHTLSHAPIANAPNVNLNQDNFHVVKHVQTTFSCVYVFGIGGASRKSMEKNAVADMIIKAELTGSQTVVNIVTKVSRKMVFFPIYERVEMTVQGTVIEFDGPSVTYMLKPDEKAVEHHNKPAVQNSYESTKKEATTSEPDKTETDTVKPTNTTLEIDARNTETTTQEDTDSKDPNINKIKEFARQMENTNDLKELRRLASEMDLFYRNCSTKNDELKKAYLDARKVFYRRAKELKR